MYPSRGWFGFLWNRLSESGRWGCTLQGSHNCVNAPCVNECELYSSIGMHSIRSVQDYWLVIYFDNMIPVVEIKVFLKLVEPMD